MEPNELEQFWEDLLAFIEERLVIPVVGAELLSIQSGGAAILLYRAVAETLLTRYGLAVSADGRSGIDRHGVSIHRRIEVVEYEKGLATSGHFPLVRRGGGEQVEVTNGSKLAQRSQYFLLAGECLLNCVTHRPVQIVYPWLHP